MQLNIPAEQAHGLAELIIDGGPIVDAVTGVDYPNARVLITLGDGGLAAAPLIVAFTVGDTNLVTYEVNAVGTAEEILS